MADINRADVAGLIPEAYSNQFLDATIAESAVLSAFTTIRVGTKINKFPVLSALPTAGFVTEAADASGVKPTTEVNWTDKTITIEEIAAIVPIHENVIEDSTIDLWGQVRPLLGQAFGAVIDAAVLFGTNKPASWPVDLVSQATTATHVKQAGVGDIADDFNDAFAFVEADGYDVNRVFTGPAMRSRLRGLRGSDGAFLYTDIKSGSGNEGVYGANLEIVKNGAWDDATALAMCADSSKLVAALRTDMTYKVLDQATVNGVNLAERDMVALRVKMRLGWETATNATALNASPVPVSIITPAGP